jgi:hypothetical protein
MVSIGLRSFDRHQIGLQFFKFAGNINREALRAAKARPVRLFTFEQKIETTPCEDFFAGTGIRLP